MGADRIADQWRQISGLVGAARHEVLALIPGDCALVTEQVEGWRVDGWRPARDAGAGAPSRVLTIIAGEALADGPARARALLGEDAEVRSSRHSPTLIFILDRKVAILGRGGRTARMVVSLTRSAIAIDTLVTIFSHHWTEAEPLAGSVVDRLSALQHKVLRYLATGVTDDVVARELEISTRTVQRHVTQVMAVVGARSRLELGIRLATRGLFRPAAG